jgi:mannose-6-phosphate isomerase-like protein (cupin superfamily)
MAFDIVGGSHDFAEKVLVSTPFAVEVTPELSTLLLMGAGRQASRLAKSYPEGYVGYMHTHARAQFLYAASGSIRLTLDTGYWIVPPKRAVWLPPRHVHQTGSLGPLEIRPLSCSRGLWS